MGPLREALLCSQCGSISRDRALALGIGAVLGESGPMSSWGARPDLRIFETSGYRAHPGYLADRYDYFNTRPPPLGEPPEKIDGRTSADLQDLPYPDGFFDLAISAEVLEHVADLEAALGELSRVLDAEGAAVITTPYVHGWPRTRVLAHRWRGRDVFMYPPEYHAEETLSYRIFGRDLLRRLADHGLAVAIVRGARPEHAISSQDLIIATRGAFLDLSTLAFGEHASGQA